MKGGNGVRKANVVTLRRAWLRKRPKKTHALVRKVRKVLKSMRSLRPLRLKNLRRTSVCDTVWFSPDVAVRERDKATNGSGVWILARQRGLGAAPRRLEKTFGRQQAGSLLGKFFQGNNNEVLFEKI
jgi:hypothetical protein